MLFRSVFAWLQREAALAEADMLRTFNCGVGLIAVTQESDAEKTLAAFKTAGETAFVIGALVPAQDSEPSVRYRGTLGS